MALAVLPRRFRRSTGGISGIGFGGLETRPREGRGSAEDVGCVVVGLAVEDCEVVVGLAVEDCEVVVGLAVEACEVVVGLAVEACEVVVISGIGFGGLETRPREGRGSAEDVGCVVVGLAVEACEVVVVVALAVPRRFPPLTVDTEGNS